MKAIMNDYRGAGFSDGSKSLAGAIRAIAGATREKASVIARDQTAKLMSDMARARQEDAGITHYVWRTAGDNRVVGRPGGLYPKGSRLHGNHWDRDGKVYRWNQPPEDGHPGKAILCRCVALPIIDPAKLNLVDPEARKPRMARMEMAVA
jgi:SPP1 gp7 family putative phage head morphogenesis protein